ncbi:WAP four-disulfide core domain protein 2 [Thalassophryne amazonica]|uniref:WAP four-disulfide core domain protein 2 n=1 Tax=Thalassophryne amazonica TaxID=390379 RepID=UPI0014718A58|nr:WAP four-disulfide core domain protein 2 [Thalassophryne amazonica]
MGQHWWAIWALAAVLCAFMNLNTVFGVSVPGPPPPPPPPLHPPPHPHPPRPEPPKPGNCPRKAKYGKWCTCDSDCHGKEKCCIINCQPMCVAPYKSKPGDCPHVWVNSWPWWPCPEECLDDSECNYDLKCCPNYCGQHECMPPIGLIS